MHYQIQQIPMEQVMWKLILLPCNVMKQWQKLNTVGLQIMMYQSLFIILLDEWTLNSTVKLHKKNYLKFFN